MTCQMSCIGRVGRLVGMINRACRHWQRERLKSWRRERRRRESKGEKVLRPAPSVMDESSGQEEVRKRKKKKKKGKRATMEASL